MTFWRRARYQGQWRINPKFQDAINLTSRGYQQRAILQNIAKESKEVYSCLTVKEAIQLVSLHYEFPRKRAPEIGNSH